jgi:hypothetical protein
MSSAQVPSSAWAPRRSAASNMRRTVPRPAAAACCQRWLSVNWSSSASWPSRNARTWANAAVSGRLPAADRCSCRSRPPRRSRSAGTVPARAGRRNDDRPGPPPRAASPWAGVRAAGAGRQPVGDVAGERGVQELQQAARGVPGWRRQTARPGLRRRLGRTGTTQRRRWLARRYSRGRPARTCSLPPEARAQAARTGAVMVAGRARRLAGLAGGGPRRRGCRSLCWVGGS